MRSELTGCETLQLLITVATLLNAFYLLPTEPSNEEHMYQVHTPANVQAEESELLQILPLSYLCHTFPVLLRQHLLVGQYLFYGECSLAGTLLSDRSDPALPTTDKCSMPPYRLTAQEK